MYCPKCSQEQASAEASFCNRCGFQLSGVKQLLANEGVLPVFAAEPPPSNQRWLRRRANRPIARLIFFSVVLFPVFMGLSGILDNPAPLIFPATALFVGVMWLIYRILFGEETAAPPLQYQAQPTVSGRKANQFTLPAAQGVPVEELRAQTAKTAEIAQPPSVVEGTTKLLNQD